MKKILCFWFWTTLLICSCSQPEKKTENDLHIITIDKVDKQSLTLSDMADSVKVIKLSNDIVLRDIAKLLLDKDENIYILDSNGNGIFKFDRNGKFERQISHKGQGPGEYIRISDFDILDDRIIISNDGETLLHFDFQGSFIGQDKKSYFENGFGNNFCMVGDTVYISWGAQSLCASYQHGEKGQRFIKSRYPDNMLLAGHPFHLTKNKNKVYYEDNFNDTIYEVSGLKCRPAIVIDFGKNKLPANIKRDMDIITNPAINNYFSDIFNFKTSDDYLSFIFILL